MKKKVETSKLLLFLLLSLLGVLLIVTIIFTLLASDSTALVAYIEGAMHLATIAVGFYFWKAKNENLHKYKRDEKIGEQEL